MYFYTVLQTDPHAQRHNNIINTNIKFFLIKTQTFLKNIIYLQLNNNNIKKKYYQSYIVDIDSLFPLIDLKYVSLLNFTNKSS